MPIIIDRHNQKIKLGGFLTRIYLETDVSLIEYEDATFEFCVDYSYTGFFSGHGHMCLLVSGNAAEKRDEGGGLYIDYTIYNWQATELEVRCVVTVSIYYERFNIGPSYLLYNQCFAGPRLSQAPDVN